MLGWWCGFWSWARPAAVPDVFLAASVASPVQLSGTTSSPIALLAGTTGVIQLSAGFV